MSGGISFFGATFLVFLVLKLTGVIAWSWWWVTVPAWGPTVLALVILGFMALAAYISVWRTARKEKKE